MSAITVRQIFAVLAILIPVLIFGLGLIWPPVNWLFIIVLPLLTLGAIDYFQHKHTIRRLYPVIGRFRYLFESVRKEIQQYFVESDTNGMPVSREYRSLIYQRAKGDRDTRPFGTVFDVNRDGYEWVNHSLAPKEVTNHDPRIRFGGPDCSKPYAASPLNISAMSYGALSKNAIMALNKGAKAGGFAHNTGEGGLSPYHLKYGGDIIWQIGTGYFGCRDEQGNFDPDLFQEKAVLPVVKMIEVKLSQGAKPGHGGILPAVKLTEEIARIRHVPMGKDVISPAAHSAFSTPEGLLEFVKKLRRLSGGKPVGFKLCIGKKDEFLGICKAMLKTGITPDFITVDGGEGGTGAAPTEMTNSVGALGLGKLGKRAAALHQVEVPRHETTHAPVGERQPRSAVGIAQLPADQAAPSPAKNRLGADVKPRCELDRREEGSRPTVRADLGILAEILREGDQVGS